MCALAIAARVWSGDETASEGEHVQVVGEWVVGVELFSMNNPIITVTGEVTSFDSGVTVCYTSIQLTLICSWSHPANWTRSLTMAMLMATAYANYHAPYNTLSLPYIGDKNNTVAIEPLATDHLLGAYKRIKCIFLPAEACVGGWAERSHFS